MFKITLCRKAGDCQSPLLEDIIPEIYFKPNNTLFFCCINKRFKKSFLTHLSTITFGGVFRRPTEKNIADCSVGACEQLRYDIDSASQHHKILFCEVDFRYY
jgi:hypothetical protein